MGNDDVISRDSFYHTVYVLNHVLFNTRSELEKGHDKIDLEKDIHQMLNDILSYTEKSNKNREEVIQKMKLSAGKELIDELELPLMCKIEITPPAKELMMHVIEKITKGALTELNVSDIDSADKILWELFCQVRGIQNVTEDAI